MAPVSEFLATVTTPLFTTPTATTASSVASTLAAALGQSAGEASPVQAIGSHGPLLLFINTNGLVLGAAFVGVAGGYAVWKYSTLSHELALKFKRSKLQEIHDRIDRLKDNMQQLDEASLWNLLQDSKVFTSEGELSSQFKLAVTECDNLLDRIKAEGWICSPEMRGRIAKLTATVNTLDRDLGVSSNRVHSQLTELDKLMGEHSGEEQSGGFGDITRALDWYIRNAPV